MALLHRGNAGRSQRRVVEGNSGVNINIRGVLLSVVSLFDFQASTCRGTAIVLVIGVCGAAAVGEKQNRNNLQSVHVFMLLEREAEPGNKLSLLVVMGSLSVSVVGALACKRTQGKVD